MFEEQRPIATPSLRESIVPIWCSVGESSERVSYVDDGWACAFVSEETLRSLGMIQAIKNFIKTAQRNYRYPGTV